MIPEEAVKQMWDFSRFMRNLSLIGQLGLSLVTPVLMCLGLCYLLTSRLGLGNWVYIPGFLFGLGVAFMTAYKVYLSSVRKNGDRKERAAFNRHY